MKKLIIISIVVLAVGTSLFGQNNTIKTNTEIGLRGRWQTGNTNQFAINPNAKLGLYSDSFNAELKVDYRYLKANDFIVNNDFWSSAIYQIKPNYKFYKTAIIRYGYSKSYRVDYSLFSGVGAGFNIRNKSALDRIQINVFAGYMSLKEETQNTHSSLSSGMLFKLISPISKGINLHWELQSYHSVIDFGIWGISNEVSLLYKVHPHISVNITHNTI
ncbi:MAG: DUF481 domain-containing protein [Flavobacteriaceae bacterium]|nr:DUF481 domain-containing protein [Flavobacteriaceae bacterium]